MRRHYPVKASKATMPISHRQTRFIEEHEAASDSNKTGQSIEFTSESLQSSALSNPETRFSTPTTVKRIARDEKGVPVLSGDPWNAYESRYGVKHWCLLRSSISRSNGKLALIRTINRPLPEEIVHRLCTIIHPNVLRTKEIFVSTTDTSIISEFLPTSLHQLCRAKTYPSEPELSSIAYQVRETC